MKRFNVTLVQPEGYHHALALAEIVEYIYAGLVACGYEAVQTKNRIMQDAHNIVICGHALDEAAVDDIPDNTILFNSEQLQNKAGWLFKGRYGSLLQRCYVWDYSLKNLAEIGHDRKAFLPLLFCPALERTPPARSAPGDTLFFYGFRSPRRIALIEAIRHAGVPVEVLSDIYGNERDVRTRNAWAVLNMRCWEDLAVFEAVRCAYPLNNGVPVICEVAAADPTFGVYEDWLFAFKTEALVENIARLHRDPVTFNRMAAEKTASFRETSGADAIRWAVEDYLGSLQETA